MAQLEKQLAEAERVRLEAEAERAELELRLAATTVSGGGRGSSAEGASSDEGDEMPQEFGMGRGGRGRATAAADGGGEGLQRDAKQIWYSVPDTDGDLYYWCPATGETTWEIPRDGIVLASAASGTGLAAADADDADGDADAADGRPVGDSPAQRVREASHGGDGSGVGGAACTGGTGGTAGGAEGSPGARAGEGEAAHGGSGGGSGGGSDGDSDDTDDADEMPAEFMMQAAKPSAAAPLADFAPAAPQPADNAGRGVEGTAGGPQSADPVAADPVAADPVAAGPVAVAAGPVVGSPGEGVQAAASPPPPPSLDGARPVRSGSRRLSLTSMMRGGGAEGDSDDEVDQHFLSRVMQQLVKQDRTLASLQIQLEQAELMLQQEETQPVPEAVSQARTKKWSRAAASLRAAIALLAPQRSPGRSASAIISAGECRREGWLLKARHASLPHPKPEDWKRRWFLLKDDCLLYFEGMSGGAQGKPKAALDVAGSHVFAYLCEPDPQRVRFNVEARGRVYQLATDDKAIAEGWIEALCNHSHRSSVTDFPTPEISYSLA